MVSMKARIPGIDTLAGRFLAHGQRVIGVPFGKEPGQKLLMRDRLRTVTVGDQFYELTQ